MKRIPRELVGTTVGNPLQGNHFLELEPKNYQAKQVSQESNKQSNLLQFSRVGDIDCNIVKLVTNIGDDTNQVELEDRFWFM